MGRRYESMGVSALCPSLPGLKRALQIVWINVSEHLKRQGKWMNGWSRPEPLRPWLSWARNSIHSYVPVPSLLVH